MPTFNDLITLALTDAGVTAQSQTPSAFDTANAITRLNWLLQQWRVKRFLVYRLATDSVLSTGAESYTVGPSGDIDIAIRPDKLESVFLRQIVPSQPNLIDYPLQILYSREDYNRIALKSMQSFPEYLWYDPEYPLGRIYPWPVPQASIYSIFISFKHIIEEVTVADLNADIELPPEYYRALYLSLTEEIISGYQLPDNPALSARAAEARNVLRASNAYIPRLQMPRELVRPGIYNPYSDQVH